MCIRIANHGDILKISRLWLAMVKEIVPNATPNLDWWRKIAMVNMSNNNYFLLFAEDGGKVLGFIDFFISPEPMDGKIHGIAQHFFVLPEWRKEISGKLYKRAIKEGKKRNVQMVDLICSVNEGDFWVRHGYYIQRQIMQRQV